MASPHDHALDRDDLDAAAAERVETATTLDIGVDLAPGAARDADGDVMARRGRAAATRAAYVDCEPKAKCNAQPSPVKQLRARQTSQPRRDNQSRGL